MRWWGWGLLLVGVLGAGAAAAWWFVLRPLQRYMPEQPFDAEAAPPPLDYADDAAWAALPGRREEADLVPQGYEEAALSAEEGAAVFFIHPTSYGGKTWNAAPDPGSRSQEFIERILAAEASALASAGPLHAPHYRQATLFAFVTHEPDGAQALQLAYGDVERAFAQFQKRIGEEAPYLIGSHSQGSLLAYRLLSEVVDPDPSLRERLVAAYTVGFPLPREGMEARFPHLPICDSDEQLGCVITFSTWAEGEEPDWDPYYWDGDTLKRQDEDAPRVCVNPLSWRDDRAVAEASLHLGALAMPPVPEGHFTSGPNHSGQEIRELPALMPEHTRATCGDQALYIEPQSDPPYGDFFADGNYHPHDFPIFWGNLRENARRRALRWRELHPQGAEDPDQ